MRIRNVLAGIAAVCISSGAEAPPTKVSFAGSMTDVPAGFFDPDFPGIGVGSAFSGTSTIDPDDVTGSITVPCCGQEATVYFLSDISSGLSIEGTASPWSSASSQSTTTAATSISGVLVLPSATEKASSPTLESSSPTPR